MKDKKLLWLQVFNGVTAVGGGLALMAGAIPMQPEWTAHTPFATGYFPGLILFAIVGGSALTAALAIYKNATGWQLASILAGIIMLFWIAGEIASIRTFHFLQVIYLITGVLAVYWTPAAKPK